MMSIVTPWRNHLEFLPDYAAATKGARVVIVDNASGDETADALYDHCRKTGGIYIRNDVNASFGKATNQGLAVIESGPVVCLNNDVSAPDAEWLAKAEHDITGRALFGPSLSARTIDRRPVLYLEGWCIGATLDAWRELGGWDEWAHSYWEDNALCWRAHQAGMRLVKTNWTVSHIGNGTSAGEPGAYDGSETNRAEFERMVTA